MSTGGGGGGYSGGGGGFSGGFGPPPMSGGGMGGFGGGFGQPFPSYGGGFGGFGPQSYGGFGGFGMPQPFQYGGGFSSGFGPPQPPQFDGGFGQRALDNAYAQPFPMSNRFNNQQPVPPPGMKINPTYDSRYALADDMPAPGSPEALRKQPFIPDPDYTPTGGGYPARDPFGQAFTQVIEPSQSISEPVAATPAMMPQMGGGLMGMLGGGLGGLYGGYQDMPYGGYQPIHPPGGGIPRLPMAAPFMPTISDETGQYTPPQVMKPAVMPPRVSDETGQFRPPQVILPTPTAPIKPPAAPIKPTAAPSGPPAVQSAISLTKNQLARMGRSSQPRFPMLASRFGPARSSG